MKTLLRTAALAGTGLATIALAGCSSGDGEAATQTETVTVTATPEHEVAATTAAPVAPTSRDVVDLAGAAGVDVCSDPESVSDEEDLSDDTLACFALTGSEQIFRTFASEQDQRQQVADLTDTAEYLISIGVEEPAKALLAGSFEDGTPWLISGLRSDLAPVAGTLEAVLTDLSRLGPTKAPEPTTEPEPTKEPEPAGPPTSFGEGTYLVGEDVAAGLYRSGGPSPDDGRYCVVYTSQEPNDLGSYIRGSTLKGPVVIEVNDGEWVTSQFCETFKQS